MIWTDKYSPKKLEDVKGNSDSIKMLKDFIINFRYKRRKSAILFGPSGTGKTSSVYAFANQYDYEILELNASDIRNKANIENFMIKATTQMSLFMKPKIILVDEIDGLSRTKDRGGSQALAKIIGNTCFPIIMCTNDLKIDKISNLIKISEIIEFEELDGKVIFDKLNEINKLENLEIDKNSLKSISSRAGGDLRAAINDLQFLSTKKIEKEDLNLIGDRKKEKEMSNILRLIFKSKDINLINRSIDDINLDDLKNWISENVVLEYKNSEIKKSFDYLSKSDVFKGRIIRWQYWRFLVYQKLLMIRTALAKGEKNGRVVNYKRPRRGLIIWQANMRNVKRKSISDKLAIYCKVSKKKAFRDIFPNINYIIKDSSVQKELDLDLDEINWINSKL